MAKRTFAKSTGLIKLDYGEAPKKTELKTAKNRIYFKNLRYNSETNELSGSINLIRVKAGKSVEDVEKMLNDFLDNVETQQLEEESQNERQRDLYGFSGKWTNRGADSKCVVKPQSLLIPRI